MPQMAPMNWLTLFFYFSVLFILFNFLNYFSFMYSAKKLVSKKSNNYTNNWKW
uniref:ATP synthase complex subunit 8 n=1 Tax=Dexiogyia corticina TaxID=347336 RepID=A0A0S2M749_9COLE|nr:ATP synthase F0 subunit 8 [Dexiogyia corticina]